jgi:AAHS family cis,cis-muconate transporter-like MFS transporter
MSMTTDETLSPTAKMMVIAIFVAMVVDGMDLQMLSLALPSITKELRLSGVSAGALGTYTLIGMGLGGAVAGRLADRFGRVAVVWWSVLVFTLCTGVIGILDSYFAIALVRAVSGFGIAGFYSVGTLIATEYAPTQIRTTVLGVLQAGWSAGYVLAALTSAYVLPNYGWRPLFFCAILPGVVALVLLYGLPDPPSAATRRHSRTAAGGFTALLREPMIRSMFILWTLATIALQFGYYGANTWLPSYLVRDLGVNLEHTGWYMAGTYTMMCVGKVITGYLADIFGRKTMWVTAGLLTAIYVPLFIFYATPGNIAYLLLAFGFLYGAPQAVSVTYMSESFPGNVRGTALGSIYSLGRTGAAISPLLIGLAATRYSIGFGLALLGVSYAICALIPGFFVREHLYNPNAIESRPGSALPKIA